MKKKSLSTNTAFPLRIAFIPRKLHVLTLGCFVGPACFVAASAVAQTTQGTPGPAEAPVNTPKRKPAATAPVTPSVTITGQQEGADRNEQPKPPAQTSVDSASPQTVQTVNVVAEKPTNRIDRQVYDVKSDISTSNSSAADALNNVPSVQVDPDGSVRLRGNQNVTILVDGKPSALLQGDNRGAALNAMPADFIESIEVVNNPGAEFGNEGGGGPILNLISRRNRRPGGFATVTGNVGTAGRYNTGVSGSYSVGYASIDSFLNYREDGRNSISTTTRERIDPTTGAVSPSTQDSVSRRLNGTLNFNSNFRYNLGEANRLGGSLGYQHGDRDSTTVSHYRDYASDGTLVNDQLRDTRTTGDSTNYNLGAFFDHKFDGDDENLKFDLRISSTKNPSESRSRNTYAVSAFGRPDSLTDQTQDPRTHITDFTGDYTRKIGQGFLTAGFKAIDTKQNFDTLFANIDPITGQQQIDPGLTNAFAVDERLLAAYATYEYRINERWSLKSGLRTERTHLDIQQITSGIDVTNSYTNYMPSAFLSYKLSEDSTLRFAYSHRVQRPNAGDLNPYVVYQSPTDRSSGNPQLKPAHSNSFELGYDTTLHGVKTDLRLFARDEDDVITQRQIVIKDENGQDVVLTTRQNFGENKSQGLEFVFNGKPTAALTLNVSGTLRHAEQTQFAGIGVPGTISGTSLSGRMRINYQLTPDDQLQFMAFGAGKQLWGQGYREPNWFTNATWQHKFTPTLTMVVNVTDPFNTNRNESHTDSDALRQTTVTRFDGRIFYIGFRYQIGGVIGNNRQQDNRDGGPRQDGNFRGGAGGYGGPGGPGGGPPM
jgi:outer membrane receptor protein involved in Fe transport